jgi:hypothetical protein
MFDVAGLVLFVINRGELRESSSINSYVKLPFSVFSNTLEQKQIDIFHWIFGSKNIFFFGSTFCTFCLRAFLYIQFLYQISTHGTMHSTPPHH